MVSAMSTRFEGKLEPANGGGAYVALPPAVVAALGGGTRVRVRGTLNGVDFRSNTMPTGGGAALGVHRATRDAAGAAFGELVAIEVEPDDDPRTIPVPPELAAALAEDAAARARFDRLAPSHRREYATWVAEAKREETRARRVEQTLARLREGA